MPSKGSFPELVVLSDGARQFAILVHALCWVAWNEASVAYRSHGTTSPRHRRSHLRLVGLLSRTEGLSTAAYSRERERLDRRFDEIFGRRYPEHYGLNLALQQFCTYKQELLRVLDAPQVPLHTNAESDIREYVTRRKISGGTRDDDGRRARDTFTGLKRLAASWGFFLAIFAVPLFGDETVSYLPDLIRARAAPQNSLSLEVGH